MTLNVKPVPECIVLHNPRSDCSATRDRYLELVPVCVHTAITVPAL